VYQQTCPVTNTDGTQGTTTTSGTTKAGQPFVPSTGCTAGSLISREFFFGNSIRPRLAVGVGFNWNSPFGPFRLNFARALMTQPGDDPKTFTFNVGTQF
jgi:outer membrane protein insertion porin family